jgi:DUF4097 and DUF4098 domain-containing protein YvlB
VQVEASESDSFIVIADKRSRRSNPDDVEIRVIEHAGSVTVCAMWRAEQMTCGSEGEYRLKDAKKNDVAVRFRILVPQGVKVDASTVNGSVEVDGAPSAVTLATVNGSIDASASGPIRAQSVNGAIHATMGELTGDEPIELKTVNGAIHAALPAKVNADLEASTVSGRINTELTVQLIGRVSPRRVNGRIGAGGRPLILSTVNGEIEITQADSDEVHQQHPKHGVRQESRVRARAPR